MPKVAQRLSDIEVQRLTHNVSANGKPYNTLHPVGGAPGLLLQVTPSGARTWIYRVAVGVRTDDKGGVKVDKNNRPIPLRRSIGLGGYPAVSLSEARQKAKALKSQIRDEGLDPVEERKAARRRLISAQLSSVTFEKAAGDFIDMKAKEFKNPRQADQWRKSLANYAYPHIGSIPVRELDLAHIESVLDPIWETIPETAKRVQGRIENILGWCAIRGYRTGDNPAQWKGYLDKVYPSSSKIKKIVNHAALSVDAVPDFMANLAERKAVAARALEFLILTASRPNEVIGDRRIGKAGITWQEVDLKKKVWTIAAERMKAGKKHNVPLTDKALAILQAMPMGEPDSLIFPSPAGGLPSDNFLTAILRRMDVKSSAHGFRSVFKDWAREYTAYADEVSELALAHVNSDATRAAYARSELIDKRRLMMNDWAQYCYHGHIPQEQDNVVSIGGRSEHA